MQISFENPEKVGGVLTLTVEEGDYKADVEKKLKEYRRRANMPGFRPGQVPMGLIRRQMGNSVKVDIINELLGKEMQKYITDNKLAVLGQPIAHEGDEPIDLEKDAPYVFRVDLAIEPEFELKLNKRDKVEYFDITVDDKLIDQQVEMFSRRFGKMDDKAESYDAEANDLLQGDLRQLDAEGNTITLSGKEAVFSVTLNSLSENVTPELTDEWVESNFGVSDDLHTADQLRSYFSDALYANNYDNAIVDYLMANSTFKELPAEITSYYIRMFLNHYNQYATAYSMDLNAFAQTQGYTSADAMLAASDAYFEHLAKQDLIFQAVAEAKSLAPTQEELDDASSTYADTYGENRAHLNALQACVLDWLEENATVA